MTDTGLTVVGAGVVGLAVAARLAPEFRDLVILERNPRHGMETSSRNSQVIHAGIYYPPGSLKARLCREGNARLYALCAAHGIPHRKLGKLVTASSEDDLPALDRIAEAAQANGVALERLSAEEARALEPHVRSAGALWSESSGILDAHSLMDHLLQDALSKGAILHSPAALEGIDRVPGGYRLSIRHGGEHESFTTERVVNAAGLEADSVAAMAGIDVDRAGYRLHWCKGSYFSAPPRDAALVRHLVYPVPGRESLGVHVVLDTGGRLRFGPDVEYLPDRTADYKVDPGKRGRFGEAARRLVPEIRDEDLEPDISGIRPKLQAKGEPVRDFVIRHEEDRGLAGFYDLVGIESPGLTAAPAIAEHVAALIAR
jgi:L-2-hydroxyglutarate oxidase LhgO